MNVFFAWLLIIISSFHLVGGHICLEVSYFIQSGKSMSEAEQLIARDLKEQTGLNASVNILSQREILPRGLIYSDFFAFSQNVGDETIYYTVSADSSNISFEKVSKQLPQQNQDERNDYFAGLQQDFTIPGFYLFSDKISEIAAPNFELAEFMQQLHFNDLTQPPDLA